MSSISQLLQYRVLLLITSHSPVYKPILDVESLTEKYISQKFPRFTRECIREITKRIVCIGDSFNLFLLASRFQVWRLNIRYFNTLIQLFLPLVHLGKRQRRLLFSSRQHTLRPGAILDPCVIKMTWLVRVLSSMRNRLSRPCEFFFQWFHHTKWLVDTKKNKNKKNLTKMPVS